jgi:hypothetical protein
MGTIVHTNAEAQRTKLRRRFAAVYLRSFIGMNISVRVGEVAQTRVICN